MIKISKNKLRSIKSFFAVNFNKPIIYSRHSFSQDGEDLILEKIFESNDNGFYVDVGAHHPFRYSNTQLLYKKGWRGINIEPTPLTKDLFDKARKRDINIQVAIGRKKGEITLYCFEDSALNTLSKKRSDRTVKSKQSKLVRKIKVKTNTLGNILSKYAKDKIINLLNIDVEGNEMLVLKSNNWKLYLPEVIVVENLNREKIIPEYLVKKGYKLTSKIRMSEIYELER